MPHYGMLRDYRFSGDVDDIRGATLYGPNNDKLGKIDDVIFDHATGTIQYAVVDTGGWLSSKKFLVPADRIHHDAKNEGGHRGWRQRLRTRVCPVLLSRKTSRPWLPKKPRTVQPVIRSKRNAIT